MNHPANDWWASLTEEKKEALHKASAYTGWEAATEAGKLVPDLTAECARLRAELNRRVQLDKGNRWYYQGDGTDHLESLTCEVVIPAKVLCTLLGNANRLLIVNRDINDRVTFDPILLQKMIEAMELSVSDSGLAESFDLWWQAHAGPIPNKVDFLTVRDLCESAAVHMEKASYEHQQIMQDDHD